MLDISNALALLRETNQFALDYYAAKKVIQKKKNHFQYLTTQLESLNIKGKRNSKTMLKTNINNITSVSFDHHFFKHQIKKFT